MPCRGWNSHACPQVDDEEFGDDGNGTTHDRGADAGTAPLLPSRVTANAGDVDRGR